jgi:hypothetical protein
MKNEIPARSTTAPAATAIASVPEKLLPEEDVVLVGATVGVVCVCTGVGSDGSP